MLLTETVNITLSGDWTSAIFDGLMFLVAVISAFYAYRAYKHQKDRSKKATACDLAKYYADDIIAKYGLISSVFSRSGLDAYIKGALSLNDLKTFDDDELNNLLSAKSITKDEFLSKVNEIDPMVILQCRLARKCTTEERHSTYNDFIEIDEETQELKVVNGAFLKSDFFQELSDMLNHLEWFAMNCQYGIADEELLYQSLHQTFLSTIWVLYPFISRNNVSNEDKLYTNIIWLFKKWYTRLSTIKKEAQEQKEAYLKMADAVKPRVYSGKSI